MQISTNDAMRLEFAGASVGSSAGVVSPDSGAEAARNMAGNFNDNAPAFRTLAQWAAP